MLTTRLSQLVRKKVACNPQTLQRKLSSSEVGRKINAIVAPLATQLETLIQSVRELNERSSNRLTAGITASEGSGSSGQRSDTIADKTEILSDRCLSLK